MKTLLKVTGKSSERENFIHEKIICRMLVDIRILIAILMRSQLEIRSTLLNNAEDMILVIKWQISCLNCVHVVVFCGK